MSPSRKLAPAVLLSVLVAGSIIVGAFGIRHSAATASGNPSPTIGSTGAGKGNPNLIVGIADNFLLGKSQKTQTSQFSAMKSIGIASVRVDANWMYIQTKGPSDFEWDSLDQEVKSIEAAGMSVDMIITGCPPWAAIPSAAGKIFAQPKSSAQYATFAGEVAKRYNAMGVKYFEIWNEPNITEFWRPQPNPAAYTADLIAAYTAIKKVVPTAIIVSGGLAPTPDNGVNYTATSFLALMYAHGAKGSFDYLGDHPYSYPLFPNTYSPFSSWSQMDATNPSIRSIMTENGDSSKKVWITEFGEPTSEYPGVSAEAQSKTLAEALAFAEKVDWVGAFYIYTWRDATTKSSKHKIVSFGIQDLDGKPKPAFYTVSAALHHGTE